MLPGLRQREVVMKCGESAQASAGRLSCDRCKDYGGQQPACQPKTLAMTTYLVVRPGSKRVGPIDRGGGITTRRAHGSVGRFPAFAGLISSHGSSRDQQLESHRRKDGSQRHNRKLVLHARQSHRRRKAGPDAGGLSTNA